MGELTSKKMQLYAYEIISNDIKVKASDLLKQISAKWTLSKSANDRRLPLGSTAPVEEDVLGNVTVFPTYAIGMVMRIAPTKEVATIPADLFEGKTLLLPAEKNTEEERPTVSVITTAYFLATDGMVISTLPPSQIKRLQTYFNWWLSLDGEEKSFKFVPMIRVSNDMKLSSMRELCLGNGYKFSNDSADGAVRSNFKVIDMASDFIRKHVSHVPDVDFLIKQHVINASLVIKFRQPNSMTVKDYERSLGYLIKPVADIDDVTIKLKEGKMLKGRDVLQSKAVQISRLDAVRISEPDLFFELKEFMKELL